MTPENAKQLLPVITAYANGAVIESSNLAGSWRAITSPSFTMKADRYRIKPKPKVVWVNQYEDSRGLPCWSNGAHASKLIAEDTGRGAWGERYIGAVKFVQADYVEEENE